MATKESAKKKFVSNVTNPLAVKSMTQKLSTYLGITVSESSAPVKNWKEKVAANAAELFDKCYDNMKSAY